MRMTRSLDALLSKRCSVNSRRALSTSAISSGEPAASRSYSHTCRPTKLFADRSHGPPPSATLSLHIPYTSVGDEEMKEKKLLARGHAAVLAVCDNVSPRPGF